MAMAAVCRPSTVTALALCSNHPNFASSSPSRSALSLPYPYAGLRLDLGLTRRGHQEGLQHRVSSSSGRSGRSRRGAGIRAGLPVVSSIPVVGPLANAVFNPVLLFIVYAAGAYRFYSGFKRTTYDNSPSTKLSMTALWPVLFLASKAYRSNFKKAIS